MSAITLFVFIAALAVLASLASGLYSMAHNGEVAHQTSAQWMVWRVVFQAAAFLLILLGIFLVS
jgi:hypothetical protein